MKRNGLARSLAEAEAMFGQLGFLLSDLRPTLHASRDPGGQAWVILLHGVYATAGVWRPLRADLESQLGLTTFSFTYGFGPGIVELSERLMSHVAEQKKALGEPSRALYLVGHSLGGLVATYAAQLGQLRGQVSGVITLAAPFRGSRRAWLVPGQAGRDIEPGHALLSQLRSGPSEGAPVRQLAIVAEDDRMIEAGSVPEYGAHVLLPRVGHNALLFDARARALVLRQLRAWVGEDQVAG
jgi:triacylglycerol lipase